MVCAYFIDLKFCSCSGQVRSRAFVNSLDEMEGRTSRIHSLFWYEEPMECKEELEEPPKKSLRWKANVVQHERKEGGQRPIEKKRDIGGLERKKCKAIVTTGNRYRLIEGFLNLIDGTFHALSSQSAGSLRWQSYLGNFCCSLPVTKKVEERVMYDWIVVRDSLLLACPMIGSACRDRCSPKQFDMFAWCVCVFRCG